MLIRRMATLQKLTSRKVTSMPSNLLSDSEAVKQLISKEQGNSLIMSDTIIKIPDTIQSKYVRL